MDEIDKMVLTSLATVSLFSLCGIFFLLSLGKKKRGTAEREYPTFSEEQLPEVGESGVQISSLKTPTEGIISDTLRENLRKEIQNRAIP